jgi:hypothetical protein
MRRHPASDDVDFIAEAIAQVERAARKVALAAAKVAPLNAVAAARLARDADDLRAFARHLAERRLS